MRIHEHSISHKVLVYHFSTLTPSGLPTLTHRLSDPRSADGNLDDRTLNAIKVGYLGSDEVLVTADGNGNICVWFTRNLQRDPLLLSVAKSAWGLAIHAERRLIAVSCNSHIATVFHCGIDSRPTHQLLSEDIDASAPTPHGSSSTSPTTTSSSEPGTPRSGATSPLEDGTSQQVLRGHEHNIPCVAFSPCGNFVATTSIDCTCRTWRLSDGKQIQQKSLGLLWGWGVSFVDQDAWMTISRAEYRQIPKDHLRPGKLPGHNVRDSPLSTAAFSQRRLPPGRDFRMIRSRWFAGPLHNTSCDERETDEEDDESRRRAIAARDGDAIEDNDDMDDRDAALFGMDDDEGEDEWEDMSSSDAEEEEEEEEVEEEDENMEDAHQIGTAGGTMTRRRSADVSSPAQDAEASADTGDDGDNEGAGMDTEDGGGTTTEDGVAVRSILARNSIKNERRASVATVTRPRVVYGESSSEQEHHATTSSRSVEADSVPVSEAESLLGRQHEQHQPQQPQHQQRRRGQAQPQPPALLLQLQAEQQHQLEQQEQQELQQPLFQSQQQLLQQESENKDTVDEQSINEDPSQFLNLMQIQHGLGRQALHDPGLQSTSMMPRPFPPQYPAELLLCATSRNIYLLSRHRPPPEEPKPVDMEDPSWEDAFSEPLQLAHTEDISWISLPFGQGAQAGHGTSGGDGDEDEDDIDIDTQFQITDLAAHGGFLDWHSGEEGGGGESEYDPDYDTDPYYEDMDDFMGTADESTEEDEEDDDEDEDDDDDDEDEEDGNVSTDLEEFIAYHQQQHGRRRRRRQDDGQEGGREDLSDSISGNRTRLGRKPAVPLLHTISVARAAAARADGRRFHHMEQFERLFVMLMVPELSVLVTASQKGSVTIFRLLRVQDDVAPASAASALASAPTPASSSQSPAHRQGRERVAEGSEETSTAAAVASGSSRKRRARDMDGGKDSINNSNGSGSNNNNNSSNTNRNGSSKDGAGAAQTPATITVQGVRYVLFPEMYLPRLEPPPLPLFGVSIVPLQRSNHPVPVSSLASDSDSSHSRHHHSRHRRYPHHHQYSGSEAESSASATTPLPSSLPPLSASSSGSFMLHLVYVDSQFYSYEIRLRNEKDDPVGLSNVFV
ncbi:hypothetical protein BGZ98_009197 [Dissophora globulifera]|nr:hypothetical protein BGZ98_009197 [Dissophora globulifera]